MSPSTSTAPVASPDRPDPAASHKVEAIWVKRVRRGPMDSRERALLVAERGLENNAQPGTRQVTLISAEAWAAVEAELGCAVDPRLRRANLMVSGVDLARSSGRLLAIGQARIRILGETRPCRLMEEQHAGLQQALDPDWRAGAWGKVEVGAEIGLGDPVAWVDETG